MTSPIASHHGHSTEHKKTCVLGGKNCECRWTDVAIGITGVAGAGLIGGVILVVALPILIPYYGVKTVKAGVDLFSSKEDLPKVISESRETTINIREAVFEAKETTRILQKECDNCEKTAEKVQNIGEQFKIDVAKGIEKVTPIVNMTQNLASDLETNVKVLSDTTQKIQNVAMQIPSISEKIDKTNETLNATLVINEKKIKKLENKLNKLSDTKNKLGCALKLADKENEGLRFKIIELEKKIDMLTKENQLLKKGF